MFYPVRGGPMRKCLFFVMVLMLGCNRAEPPDPESSRLATGTEAIVYAKDEKVMAWDLPDGHGMIRGWNKNFVTPGVKIRVISDEMDHEFPRLRDVRVMFLEGELRDASGIMCRKNIRPTPSP
jgi:hypothetical protein